MDIVGGKRLWSYADKGDGISEKVSNSLIRKSHGKKVKDYIELAALVAELQYRNPDYVLLFRGQDNDYRDQEGSQSTCWPRFLRSDELWRPWWHKGRALKIASDLLVKRMSALNTYASRKMRREKAVQWAILQHYDIVDTPFLDVTQSLRIAASFASSKKTDEAFLLVFAMPQISGGVTVSAEANVELVRLASVCPPEAVRPHIQEAYALGDYPQIDIESSTYSTESDCANRLIAKFRFSPAKFWEKNGNFPQVPNEALYPSSHDDPMARIADEIKYNVEAQMNQERESLS